MLYVRRILYVLSNARYATGSIAKTGSDARAEPPNVSFTIKRSVDLTFSKKDNLR